MKPQPLLFLALLLSGCVLTNAPPRNSRFMVDITGLEKVDFYKDTWVYCHPQIKVTDYRSFIVAPVEVYHNTAKKIPKKTRPIYDAEEGNFQRYAEDVIGKGYPVSAQPGPGVLRIEFNVVDIKPIVRTKDHGNDAIITDPNTKGTKIEADCFDSVTNERIFALSTLYKGQEYAAYKDPALLPAVELAFQEWLMFFKKRFDAAMQRQEQKR